ncbi:monosaccharide ABC transporter ATP-binding protein, CUT2 family [Streptomyces lincolnensis]|uniref:Monosaccharide ABC transporter ATP-binding protein, CUT2 family n=1 Tax=Streptomyces lincolnensis TaxID=1915 RepID=A0A1B1MBI9_STRLN|nr:sugar ABC transporter ATP-binding protein [Streptomyces lincolnensis]ANS65894.1 monosaccharide ABC transporter ATP-binding protein, CUT2 family [Streptomyces lincolnensis]AXG54343.1 monosaccharide ABC transporter ATP-binding protein, CUT2 family [Streptomyces lincolnensis]QMV08721.1 ATP-binding cassette domain-containing protein [Streptomyces lincolnensis]
MAEPQPVLEMTGIVKEFPGVRALSGVDFRLFPGEIHALMGENGAGKSTLIKVLTGVYSLDGGTVTLDGESVRFGSPLQAQQAGISTVYQEVNLCPNLSVAENIFIGREPTRAGRIQWKRMREEAAELVDRLGLDIDVAAPLSSYPLAVQQLVAIVRSVGTGGRDAAGSGTKVLVLDEPTSSLDRDEVLELFRLMRQLRDEGVAILFVSHFLDQIYEVCDRMTILRNGTLVGEHLVRDLDQVGLIELMIGKALDQLEELHEHQLHSGVGETLVKAEGLGRTGGIAPFDLEIKKGEVLGLAGLLGSGRTELARLLFGADQPDSGKVTIGGKQVSMSAPNDAIAAGVAFCSENRKSEGLVPDLTVRENIVLALQAARGWTRPIPASQRDELVAKYIKALDIRPADPEARVGRLSGGNQQKVLLARWLITQPKLLILDEPTRGIDIGAKTEIQKLVVSLSEDGMSVLYIAAELEEVLRLSHTIGVLRDRRLVARLTNGPEITTSKILETIASGEHQ